MFYTTSTQPVLCSSTAPVLASAGAVLAYVGDNNDVLHWSASAGPVLAVGAGIWYWCGTGICRA